MDCKQGFDDPINQLPKKCTKCGFPDLDFVPKPYFVIRGRSTSPSELAMAENGNLFVRPRVRQVLEVLAPKQCNFFPTVYKGTSQETPWLLVVPSQKIVTATVKASIRRCSTCGEPTSAHPGTQYAECLFGHSNGDGWIGEAQFDIFKSANWCSSEVRWDEWMHRHLFVSVRLLHLLQKIKAKGLYQATCGKTASPDAEESDWIRNSLRKIEKKGIPLHPSGTLSTDDAKWLRSYIKAHTRKTPLNRDFKKDETKLKIKLPKSYLDFISTVGSVSYRNVDEQDGFTVHVHLPHELDATTYRAGRLETDDEESQVIDGVMFASTEYGDCFCFDIRERSKEPPVVIYKHEYTYFEPFAENFAACIKRFASSRDT